MSKHAWSKTGLASPQSCAQCGLSRELAGAWWSYARGREFFGIVSPEPPCDREWRPGTKRQAESQPRAGAWVVWYDEEGRLRVRRVSTHDLLELIATSEGTEER